jgi:hypothetical protein
MTLDHLHTFAKELQRKFALPGQADPEDQLKAPVASLIANVGKEFGIEVDSKTEARLTNVRPDEAVYTSGLICGHVELKQPGLGADAPRLKGKHNKQQWERLKSLPKSDLHRRSGMVTLS